MCVFYYIYICQDALNNLIDLPESNYYLVLLVTDSRLLYTLNCK